MKIEIRDGDEIVFAMHDDGGVMVQDNSSKIASAVCQCGEASEYLKAWLSKKQCNASTESETHQCSQGT